MNGCRWHENKVMGIACALFVLAYSSVQASVIDLRTAIRNETSLVHYYTFEGPQEDNYTLRKEDRAGTSSLYASTRASAWATYTEAYDPLSMGGTCVYLNGNINAGSAWRTTNAIALPSTMTVECLFRPNQIPTTETYVLGTRDGDNRGYYIRQNTDSKLETRVGAGAYRPIVSNYATGHWYYVVSTYSVSDGKTTINSYVADVTAGDELQHTIVNEVENGHYGSSATLGVGCLHLSTESQYFAPCTIDEVAFYNTVFDASTIDSHLTELKRTLPSIEYREIFPDDGVTFVRYLPREGWQCHRSTNAIHITNGPLIEKWHTAFDENIEAIASFPQYTGVTNGYLSNHAGPTGTNYLYWTEEMTNNIDVSWLKLVKFDARFEATRNISFALRVDTNSTPANMADDAWFYGLDFDQAQGNSLLSIPTSGEFWHCYWFEPGAGEWAALDFEAESHLNRGETEVTLPTNGLITAFGFFEKLHVYKKNERLDNVTLYTRRVYPPPPPRGTLILIQ